MSEQSPRSPTWKWWICGLLLFASTINYMDRQTLANASVRITRELSLNQEQYGNLELVFGWAFAAGSLFFGWIADRYPVRWVYPAALLGWSLMGCATGWTQSYSSLLACRMLLGFFEGGHWPCAIKTTRLLLDAKDRSMGNSVLQSGTSIGAILTPLLMRWILTEESGSWRAAFQWIGLGGLSWLIGWFALVRRTDLDEPATVAPDGRKSDRDTIARWLFSRRMGVVIVVIALINTGWQILRAWLPRFLQQGRGYTEGEALYFNSLFYVATDVGVIGAGAATIWLFRRGWGIHGARQTVFLGCALLSALTLALVPLPRGPLLLGGLLCVGAGALGVFPIYHALTQDISRRHQGMVSGIGGVAAWALSPAQKYFGRLVDRTGSFDLGFAVIGCLPLLAFVVLWLFWPKEPATGGKEC